MAQVIFNKNLRKKVIAEQGQAGIGVMSDSERSLVVYFLECPDEDGKIF